MLGYALLLIWAIGVILNLPRGVTFDTMDDLANEQARDALLWPFWLAIMLILWVAVIILTVTFVVLEFCIGKWRSENA